MATITETGTIDLKAQKEAHDEAINAAASDATTKANAAQTAAINAAASDATTKANAAQTAAINAAASDATTKANAAAKTATDYITPDGTSTAAFHPEASSTNQVKVDGTGVDIIKSGASVAKYGDIARIGKSSESRVEIDYHSLKLIDKDGNTYLHVSDLRDTNGSATMLETFIVDDTEISSNGTRFRLSYDIKTPVNDNIISVMVDDVVLNTSEYIAGTPYYLRIYAVLNLGQKVQIKYSTETATIAFSFGQRAPDSTVGGESFAEGRNNTASGRVSHAEGVSTEASGSTSHAEGYHTQASNVYSHAEGEHTQAIGSTSHAEGEHTQAIGSTSHAEGGYTGASGDGSHAEGWLTVSSGTYSHAEGYRTQASGNTSHAEGMLTEASGGFSHAEGRSTEANGDYSHAQNHGTIARGEAQTAIGKYNIDNIDEDLAFIIGNGTDVDARSDAFTVDWDGNTFTSGSVKLKVPTIDRDNPSSSIYDSAHSILLLDKDGELIGLVRCLQLSDGRIGSTLSAFNENTSGSQVNNSLNVMVDRNGNSSYSMTDPEAFRSAISAFSTSGGIITGPVYVKNTVIDRKVNPSSAQYTTDVGGNSAFQLCDKNGAMLGYLRASKQTDGRTGLDLRVWNSDTDGNNVIHGAFQIFIDRSGTVSYSITNQANFRNAIGASSGVFPTSVGGTGITSNPSMLINLGSTSAASVFAASPRPGVTGTLPRANGGTGMSARTTGTITRSGLSTDGTINVYSNGVTCTLAASNVKLKAALATSSSVQLATLPAGYRPPMNVFTNVSSPNQTYNGGAWVRVDNSGVVTLGNYSGSQFTTSTQLYFTITWAL